MITVEGVNPRKEPAAPHQGALAPLTAAPLIPFDDPERPIGSGRFTRACASVAEMPSERNISADNARGYSSERSSVSSAWSAVRQAPNGSCTGAPVDLTAAATYTIVQNDFTTGGGDGYPNFASRAVLHSLQDQVVALYLAAQGTIAPAIQGRIVCTTSGATACPVVVP